SEIVIYPYGCSSNRTSNKEVVETIGKEVGEKIGYKAGTSWELLYDVDGGDIDWMYNAYGVIPFVIEVNSSREGFHPDYNQWRDVTVKRNRSGWQYLLERSFSSGIRGTIKISNKLEQDFQVRVLKEGREYQQIKSKKTG